MKFKKGDRVHVAGYSRQAGILVQELRIVHAIWSDGAVQLEPAFEPLLEGDFVHPQQVSKPKTTKKPRK